MNIGDLVESGSGIGAASISRRSLLRKMIGAGALAVAGGLVVGGGKALAQDGTFFRTTSALNLRTGPGPRRRVLLVIPDGAVVSSHGQSKYGYHKVGYLGTVGWAYADYLVDADEGETEVPVPVGTARTTDVVNFRNGASTGARVIQVLPANTQVDVFDIWENGYRMVGYAQITGWIHADYLSGQSGPLGGYVTITSALNLREEANTSSRVLAVMPEGARAFRGDVIANGFLGITYNGTFGWAHMDYLVSD